jgi:transcription initiation factor IIF auxiliary subunit
LSKKARRNFIEAYDGYHGNSGKTEEGAIVENLDATQRKAQTIEFDDFVVESTSRMEVPRILEQLKKIAELKIENFTQLPGAKFENTVKEMFSIIKDLEGHLRDVLKLNASLREEVRDKRKRKDELQAEKEAVERKIATLEQDFPRAQDLEKRLDIAIEEVEKHRALYKLEKEKLEKLEASSRVMASQHDKIREERDDAYREIVVLEDKLKSMTRANQ